MPRAAVKPVSLPVSQLGRVAGTLWWWPAERSYTRQPVAEFHTWGSPPILSAALTRFCDLGARLARPGEFTLRAFLAGRIDLAQAEAVFGLATADRPDAFARALQQSAGGVFDPLRRLRSELLDLLADIEAGLDFVDEDIQFLDRGRLVDAIRSGQVQVRAVLQQIQSRAAVDEAARVVIVGRPNAGKSSLLNALAERPSAVVSPQAGTTTDYVTARVDWQGQAIELVDTAGFVTDRAGVHDSPVETARRERSQAISEEQLQAADIVIWCHDGSVGCDHSAYHEKSVAPESVIHVITKYDSFPRRPHACGELDISSHTGFGLDVLRQKILEKLAARRHNEKESFLASTRCRNGLQRVLDSLFIVADLASQNSSDELIAAEIRTVLETLGELVGTVYTDELLDRIFGRFCIGK